MTRVLVVDDKEENLYYLSALLGAHGCEVQSARHGGEALVKARQAPPDLVISDLLMPVMDGYTLLRHWKADPRLRQIPFIVYTATYTDAEDERLALDLGADAFIVKPCEPDEFLARVSEVQANEASAVPLPPQTPTGDEKALLEEYSKLLIRKLEEKTLELEATNQSLQQDIAERKKVEAALRESEAEFRLLTEAMPQLVWMTRADGWNTFFNQRWVQYTGQSVAQSEGHGWLTPFHPDDQARAAVLWKAATQSGGAYALEARLRKQDGSYHWWLIRGLPLHDAQGTIVKWFGTCTDIDELKQAAAARDKAERDASERAAVLDALFESVPDVVIQVDLAGKIQFINRPLPHLPDLPELGSSVFKYLPAEQRPLVQGGFDTTLCTAKSTSFESMLSDPSGTSTAYWCGISPVTRDGKITGAVIVARDITERKQTHAQLIASDRMASVGTLAAGVAHEINNPLASVTANLALAKQEVEALAEHHPVPKELLDELRDAIDGAERVRTIVRDLKIFSRADEDKRGPVNVEQVLESTLRLAWNELRHRSRLVKQYGNVPAVEANEARLGQVLLNLVVNAAQAIPEGDYEHNEVRIETRLDGDNRVVISITDTGAGIAPEVQRRLFTPFFTTKPVGVGTGIGLSICQRILAELGGSIDFSSEQGKGSTFRVLLPVASVRPEAAPSVRTKTATASRRGRILVIDDEMMITSTVERILSSEHDVYARHSAAQAMELFNTGERFDVVVCDLMMPQITGMELYAALERLDPQQAGRVLFATGGAFTSKARAFLATVPNPRIEKPFEVLGLRALINKLVAAATSTRCVTSESTPLPQQTQALEPSNAHS